MAPRAAEGVQRGPDTAGQRRADAGVTACAANWVFTALPHAGSPPAPAQNIVRDRSRPTTVLGALVPAGDREAVRPAARRPARRCRPPALERGRKSVGADP